MKKKRNDGADITNAELNKWARGMGHSGDRVDAAMAYTDERGGTYKNDHSKAPLDIGKGAGRGATPETLKIAKGGR